MKNKLNLLFRKLGETVARYPLVLLMAFLMNIAIIVWIELDYRHPNLFDWIKLVIVAALGISLQFGLKMAAQSGRKWRWIEGLGILFLIGLYFYLPKSEKGITIIYGFVLALLFLLSHLLVAIIPFLKREKSQVEFWQYNKNLFIHFILSAIFTLVLVGGVNLAIWAVNELFDIHFNFEIYGDVAVTLGITGGTLIFLLFSENGFDFLKKESPYPMVLKFFTQFVLIPLLAIYLVILYLYSIKILINWELPRGWVSYLVLAYSVVGLLALLLVHPLIKDDAKSWVKVYSKLFFYTLVPLLVLLFVAIFTRVLAYGFTEPRYFVLALALWLSVVVAYFVFSKASKIKFIPISLFVFGLFSLLFPYLNAFSVAKRSQEKELMNQLTKMNLLKEGKINFDQPIDSDTVYEIIDKFDFLAERGKQSFLNELLPDEFKDEDESPRRSYYFLSDHFVRDNSIKTVEEEFYVVNLRSKRASIQLEEYQYAIFLGYYNSEFQIDEDKFEFTNNLSYNFLDLKLKLNGNETLDFEPLMKNLFENYHSDGEYQLDEIALKGILGNYQVKLNATSLSKTVYDKSNTQYSIGNCVIYLKEIR